MLEAELKVPQSELLMTAVGAFPDSLIEKEVKREGLPLWKLVDIYINERAVGYWKEQGYSEPMVDAVLEVTHLPCEHARRLTAVRVFTALPEAESLAAANKRIQNILRKAGEVGDRVEVALLAEDAETSLFDAVTALTPRVEADLANLDYTGALMRLAALKAPVDRFFDEVMVMAEEPLVRANRLGLLNTLGRLMNCVADIGQLSGK